MPEPHAQLFLKYNIYRQKNALSAQLDKLITILITVPFNLNSQSFQTQEEEQGMWRRADVGPAWEVGGKVEGREGPCAVGVFGSLGS